MIHYAYCNKFNFIVVCEDSPFFTIINIFYLYRFCYNNINSYLCT